jgi:hypothetical protein
MFSRPWGDLANTYPTRAQSRSEDYWKEISRLDKTKKQLEAAEVLVNIVREAWPPTRTPLAA